MGITTRSNMSPSPGNTITPNYQPVNQGLPTLLVMIAVLAIILLFCFWSAPGVRDFCRRSVCCHCPMDEPEHDHTGYRRNNERSTTPAAATPTIILLPFGRMLVVDRSVFNQFNVDQTGIDFMELSANIIRAHRIHELSTPSILDSDTSKCMTPTSINNCSPPSYNDIFDDLPPSYSELSLIVNKKMITTNNEQTTFANIATNSEYNSNNMNGRDMTQREQKGTKGQKQQRYESIVKTKENGDVVVNVETNDGDGDCCSGGDSSNNNNKNKMRSTSDSCLNKCVEKKKKRSILLRESSL